MKEVMKFIKWNHELYYPCSVLPSEIIMLEDGLGMEDLFELTKKICYYSKRLMDEFTELIWQEIIQNQLQLEGWPNIPRVSLSPLPLPHGTTREQEVLIMSLF